MKTPRLLYFGLVLAAGTGVGLASVGAETPPASKPAELYTVPVGTKYGKFDGHGKLVEQTLTTDYGEMTWHDTLVYYPQGSPRGIKLHRNISTMNAFLAAEVLRPKTARTFLGEPLSLFLFDNLGEITSHSITRADLDVKIDNFLVERDSRSASAAKRAQLKAKLRGYVCSWTPVIEGNAWTVNVNMITDDGAVEHWLIKGRVTPLQIDRFLCEPKEPTGTFAPLMLIH